MKTRWHDELASTPISTITKLPLARFKIHSVYDLLYFFPRSYFETSHLLKLSQIKLSQEQCIYGEIYDTNIAETHRRKIKIIEAVISQANNKLKLCWYGRAKLGRLLSPGDIIIARGTARLYNGEPTFWPVEFETLPVRDFLELQKSGIIPAYLCVSPVISKNIRWLVKIALERYADKIHEILPDFIIKKHNFTHIKEAIKNIHLPSSAESFFRARQRLAYEEFFLLQIVIALRRRVVKQRQSHKIVIDEFMDKEIKSIFPFELTQAQKRAIAKIRNDLASGRPMHRLLQGDVGSGKTAVAVYLLLSMAKSGFQSAIMAPTEILAQQHFLNIQNYLKNIPDIRVCLLTSALSQKQRLALYQKIKEHRIDIVVGTHSLIQEGVEFAKLGAVVIDEQHKFGVHQRAQLMSKGISPHVLVMSATPIPRTLSLTIFGDLDISVLDQMPPGRKPVKTYFFSKDMFYKCVSFVKTLIEEGRQVFFVYPLVKESEKMVLKAATTMYETLKNLFPRYNVALVHGQLPQKQKDEVMQRFRNGEIQILVATTVIEVGIDIPKATVMVIEHSERYGLSQLHQLRGRITRGEKEGICIIFGTPKTPQARERLKAFLNTTNGFKIAEEDLRIRGPGEFLGTKQSGLSDLRVANILKDTDLLIKAREDVFYLLQKGENLNGYLSEISRRFPRSKSLLFVG